MCSKRWPRNIGLCKGRQAFGSREVCGVGLLGKLCFEPEDAPQQWLLFWLKRKRLSGIQGWPGVDGKSAFLGPAR